MPPAARTGLILQHEANGPAGRFGNWLEKQDAVYMTQRVWEHGVPADPSSGGSLASS